MYPLLPVIATNVRLSFVAALMLAGVIGLAAGIVLDRQIGEQGRTQPSPTPASAALSCWRGDFESGVPGTGRVAWDRLQAVPGAFAIVTDPVRQGLYAGSFTIRPGDLVANGERAEVVKHKLQREGDEVWLSWSLYLPSAEFHIEPGAHVIVTQWHGGGGPPLFLVHVQDDGHGLRLLLVNSGGPARQQGDDWDLGAAPLDQWIDLQMHVKWSADSSGLIEFWVDGKRVVSSQRPTMHASTRFLYLKQGNYRPPYELASTLYIDGTLLAPTEEALRACHAQASEAESR